MRTCSKIFIICLILLGTARPTLAGETDTISFIIDNLIIDASSASIHYTGSEDIRSAGHPSVPAKTFLYHSIATNSADRLQGRVLTPDTIYLTFTPLLNVADIPTSDKQLNIPQPEILSGSKTAYPDSPCLILTETVPNGTVWSVTVFPVQFLEGNRIVFNRQIEISSDETTAYFSRGNFPSDEVGIINPNMSPSQSTAAYSCPVGSDFVIVTSPLLAESFETLINLKRRTGFGATIAITDSIYAHYSGIDQAEALRNYLKDFYQAGGRYVILGGDEDNVPVRYAYYYNTSTVPDLAHSMICDLYFADFDGNWDYDGDGVWGEPNDDQPDLGPEVALGRLPFSTPEQVTQYTAKLENYLFQVGQNDLSFLNRAIFLNSDQMRDYFEHGQQYPVAEKFPATFTTNCEQLAETPNGNDPSPLGPTAEQTTSAIAEGYGIINILAHGRSDGFILNSSQYNENPHTYMFTETGDTPNADLDDLTHNGKSSFYYSIACNQGAFDAEKISSVTAPSVVEKLLSLDSSGAVGIVAFSRWGWVASSYKLMEAFYQHLFDDAVGYPIEAMHRSHLDYPYYRDQIYGQNFFGDPSIPIYTALPTRINLEAPVSYRPGQPLTCRVLSGGIGLSNQSITASFGNGSYQTVISDDNGYAEIFIPSECIDDIRLTAYSPGQISAEAVLTLSITSGADDDDTPLPIVFGLGQNYPNPFNPTTTIEFTLPRAGEVSLKIYDILGRLVANPIRQRLEAGQHKITWGGTDQSGKEVASGIYLYRLTSESGIACRKMVLVR